MAPPSSTRRPPPKKSPTPRSTKVIAVRRNTARRSIMQLANSSQIGTLQRVRELLDRKADIVQEGGQAANNSSCKEEEENPRAARLKVAVRVRPRNTRERNANAREIVSVAGPNMIVFDPPQEQEEFFYHNKKQKDITAKKFKNQKFAFDHVYDREVVNETIFTDVMQPLLNTLLSGFNCSVFAYGATGSGKTYTMLGGAGNPGLTYLTMNELYRRLDGMNDEFQTQIVISYFEVYNEQVRDLLNPTGQQLLIREVGNGIQIANLTFHHPEGVEHLLEMLQIGNSRRSQHPTDHNAESSRSHALLQVHIHMRERHTNMTTNSRTAKLIMVDLAGSEKGSATGCKGARFREGSSINRSLLALSNCISALANGKRYCSFRDSKLTRILKDSLGGNCRTVMVANVSPADSLYEDTLNTLRYAEKAKKISCCAKKNAMTINACLSQYTKVVEEMTSKIEALEKELGERAEYEKNLKDREMRLMEKEEDLATKERILELREEELNAREEDIALREFNMQQNPENVACKGVDMFTANPGEDKAFGEVVPAPLEIGELSGTRASTLPHVPLGSSAATYSPGVPDSFRSTSAASFPVISAPTIILKELPTPHHIIGLPNLLERMTEYVQGKINFVSLVEKRMQQFYLKRERYKRISVMAHQTAEPPYSRAQKKLGKKTDATLKQLKKALCIEFDPDPMSWQEWRNIVHDNMFQVSSFNLHKFFIGQFQLIHLVEENKILRDQLEYLMMDVSNKEELIYTAASLANVMHNLLKHYEQNTRAIDKQYADFVAEYCGRVSVRFAEGLPGEERNESLSSVSFAPSTISEDADYQDIPEIDEVTVTSALTDDAKDIIACEFGVLYRSALDRLTTICSDVDDTDKMIEEIMAILREKLRRDTNAIAVESQDETTEASDIDDEPQPHFSGSKPIRTHKSKGKLSSIEEGVNSEDVFKVEGTAPKQGMSLYEELLADEIARTEQASIRFQRHENSPSVIVKHYKATARKRTASSPPPPPARHFQPTATITSADIEDDDEALDMSNKMDCAVVGTSAPITIFLPAAPPEVPAPPKKTKQGYTSPWYEDDRYSLSMSNYNPPPLSLMLAQAKPKAMETYSDATVPCVEEGACLNTTRTISSTLEGTFTLGEEVRENLGPLPTSALPTITELVTKAAVVSPEVADGDETKLKEGEKITSSNSGPTEKSATQSSQQASDCNISPPKIHRVGGTGISLKPSISGSSLHSSTYRSGSGSHKKSFPASGRIGPASRVKKLPQPSRSDETYRAVGPGRVHPSNRPTKPASHKSETSGTDPPK